MSGEQTKEWNQIGTITEQWVKASYPKADAQSAWKYKDRMNRFLGFIGVTDVELIQSTSLKKIWLQYQMFKKYFYSNGY
jgi:hypothetical protein